MPITLVKLRSLKGKKFKGINIRAHTIFQPVTDRTPGNRRASESAKSTIKATQAATSSSVKRMLVAILALRPNEMNAMSEKVIRLGSRSMHRARILAVQAVTAAQRKSEIMPHSQPAYFMPMGRLRRPTPIKTLDECCQQATSMAKA